MIWNSRDSTPNYPHGNDGPCRISQTNDNQESRSYLPEMHLIGTKVPFLGVGGEAKSDAPFDLFVDIDMHQQKLLLL